MDGNTGSSLISGEALAAIELVASLLYIADVSLGERSSDRVSAPDHFSHAILLYIDQIFL